MRYSRLTFSTYFLPDTELSKIGGSIELKVLYRQGDESVVQEEERYEDFIMIRSVYAAFENEHDKRPNKKHLYSIVLRSIKDQTLVYVFKDSEDVTEAIKSRFGQFNGFENDLTNFLCGIRPIHPSFLQDLDKFLSEDQITFIKDSISGKSEKTEITTTGLATEDLMRYVLDYEAKEKSLIERK